MPIRDPIRALVRDRAGWLWIATKGGLHRVRKPNGDIVGDRRRAGLRGDRAAAAGRGAGRSCMMVIGTDEQGHEAARGRQADDRGRAIARCPRSHGTRRSHRGVTRVVVDGRRSTCTGSHAGERRRCAAASRATAMRLVPLASGARRREWVIDPLELVLPPGATDDGLGQGDQLLIGTRDLGIARYREGDPHPRDWLRRREMFEDANTLSVACSRPQDCWVATGARQAWRWTGDRFASGGPDQQIVLAVARDPSGPIYALHRAPQDELSSHLSRIEGATWTAMGKVLLATPGDAPEISFARFASSGSLWVGLRYRDGVERRAYGIAIIEPATGKVAYHRTELPNANDRRFEDAPDPGRGDRRRRPRRHGVVRDQRRRWRGCRRRQGPAVDGSRRPTAASSRARYDDRSRWSRGRRDRRRRRGMGRQGVDVSCRAAVRDQRRGRDA